MKLILFSLFFAFGATLASHAQGRDTAFAVRKLFRQKRHGASALMGGGASMYGVPATLNGAVGGALVGAPPALVGLYKANRYSAGREAQILSSYAAGWPIPADVRRKLRRKHFHRTAQDLGLTPP